MGPFTAIFPPRATDASIESIQKQLWDTSLDESQHAMSVNVLGPFYTFVAFLRLLEAGNTHANSRGRVEFIQSQFITICSLASFSRKEHVGHAYLASKAALVHLTKNLATNFGPLGIRANAIAPGFYITEMTEVGTLPCHSLMRATNRYQFVVDGKDLTQPGSMPKEIFPMTRSGAPEVSWTVVVGEHDLLMLVQRILLALFCF